MFAEVFDICRSVCGNSHCSNGILPGAKEVVRAKKHITPFFIYKAKMAKNYLKITIIRF